MLFALNGSKSKEGPLLPIPIKKGRTHFLQIFKLSSYLENGEQIKYTYIQQYISAEQ